MKLVFAFACLGAILFGLMDLAPYRPRRAERPVRRTPRPGTQRLVRR